MFTIIGTVLTSLLSGGATGLLGVVMQRFFDLKNRSHDLEIIKANHENALELEKLRIQGEATKAEGARAVAQVEADAVEAKATQERLATEAVADQHMLEAAQMADKATYYASSRPSDTRWGSWVDAVVSLLLGVTDMVRGLTRPLLTAYLVYMLYTMKNFLDKTTLVTLPVDKQVELWNLIVGAFIYLSTVAVVFWFGTRPNKLEK